MACERRVVSDGLEGKGNDSWWVTGELSVSVGVGILLLVLLQALLTLLQVL